MMTESSTYKCKNVIESLFVVSSIVDWLTQFHTII